jgi:hypothetical protein
MPLSNLFEMEVHAGAVATSYVNLKRRPLDGNTGVVAVIAIDTSGGTVKNCVETTDYTISGRTLTYNSDLSGYEAVIILYQHEGIWSSSSSSSSSTP